MKTPPRHQTQVDDASNYIIAILSTLLSKACFLISKGCDDKVKLYSNFILKRFSYIQWIWDLLWGISYMWPMRESCVRGRIIWWAWTAKSRTQTKRFHPNNCFPNHLHVYTASTFSFKSQYQPNLVLQVCSDMYVWINIRASYCKKTTPHAVFLSIEWINHTHCSTWNLKWSLFGLDSWSLAWDWISLTCHNMSLAQNMQTNNRKSDQLTNQLRHLSKGSLFKWA